MSLGENQNKDKGKGLTIEEIRSRAPKYATHYEFQDNEIVYYAKDTIGRWCYVDDDIVVVGLRTQMNGFA